MRDRVSQVKRDRERRHAEAAKAVADAAAEGEQGQVKDGQPQQAGQPLPGGVQPQQPQAGTQTLIPQPAGSQSSQQVAPVVGSVQSSQGMISQPQGAQPLPAGAMSNNSIASSSTSLQQQQQAAGLPQPQSINSLQQQTQPQVPMNHGMSSSFLEQHSGEALGGVFFLDSEEQPISRCFGQLN